jgi:hypothetical protein
MWCQVAWYVDASIAEETVASVFRIRVLSKRWCQHMSILFYRMRQRQGCHIVEEIYVVIDMRTSNLAANIVQYLKLSNLIYCCWVFSILIAFPIQTHLQWWIRISTWEVHSLNHGQNSCVWFFIITLTQMQKENPTQQRLVLSMQTAVQARWWEIWSPVGSVLFSTLTFT